jgi:ACR3 family arsenite transporter
MTKLLSNPSTTLLLLFAITLGSLLGGVYPNQAAPLSSAVDPFILILVSLIFFEISFGKIIDARQHLRFLSIAWVANFIIIPLIGWGIAALFLSGQPLLFAGLLIYFIAPCTDWFLGFTRLARGNVALGSVLLPINLISQLLLFPVFLGLFAGKDTGIEILSIGSSMWHWFLVPLTGAVALHQVLKRLLSTHLFTKILRLVNTLIPMVIAALVTCIFSGNITIILENVSAFLLILIAVFVFFLTTYFLGVYTTRHFKLGYPEHALFTMTTAARNAPLMLGLTTAAFPNEPLIYAALIIGMLVEFPHLTLLKHMLLKQCPEIIEKNLPTTKTEITETEITKPAISQPI